MKDVLKFRNLNLKIKIWIYLFLNFTYQYRYRKHRNFEFIGYCLIWRYIYQQLSTYPIGCRDHSSVIASSFFYLVYLTLYARTLPGK